MRLIRKCLTSVSKGKWEVACDLLGRSIWNLVSVWSRIEYSWLIDE